MAKGELHSDNIKIEQKPTYVVKDRGDQVRGRNDDMQEISDLEDRADVVRADPSVMEKEYLSELAFMQEPVKIRLEQSSERNAPTMYPVWVNGRGADVWTANGVAADFDDNGKWYPWTYLPVGHELVVKRSVLEIIARAKVDTVRTKVVERPDEDPQNLVERYTSSVAAFSVIEDRNPRGSAWLREVRRRNY